MGGAQAGEQGGARECGRGHGREEEHKRDRVRGRCAQEKGWASRVTSSALRAMVVYLTFRSHNSGAYCSLRLVAS